MDVRIHIHYFFSIPSPWSKQLMVRRYVVRASSCQSCDKWSYRRCRPDATGTGTSSLDAHVAQHQLGACLVVELRGDVETLGLGEHITGDFLRSTVRQLVGSGRESKFGPLYFFPCNLHLPNVAHEMKMPRGLVSVITGCPCRAARR